MKNILKIIGLTVLCFASTVHAADTNKTSASGFVSLGKPDSANDAQVVSEIWSETNRVNIRATGYGVLTHETNGDWVVTFTTNAPPATVPQAEALVYGQTQLQRGFSAGVRFGVTTYALHPEINIVTGMDALIAKALASAQADERK